jgi:hypothetical protein
MAVEIAGGVDAEAVRRQAVDLMAQFGIGLSVVDLQTRQRTALNVAECLSVQYSPGPVSALFRWVGLRVLPPLSAQFADWSQAAFMVKEGFARPPPRGFYSFESLQPRAGHKDDLDDVVPITSVRVVVRVPAAVLPPGGFSDPIEWDCAPIVVPLSAGEMVVLKPLLKKATEQSTYDDDGSDGGGGGGGPMRGRRLWRCWCDGCGHGHGHGHGHGQGDSGGRADGRRQ